MPVTGPHKSWLGTNTYYETTCSKCGWSTKAMGGGRKYAQSLLTQHNSTKHGKKK